MPLYDFYCQSCHKIFTFRAQRVRVGETPLCPQCAGSLKREISPFSHIIRGKNSAEVDDSDAACDRMDRVMAEMGERMQMLEDDSGDPREAVSILREMAAAGGVSFKPEVLEAMARIDAGEDPEKIDEMFGEVFETENPFAEINDETTGQQPEWWRRLREPQRDPQWYDWQ
jgi:putative FmdB family regulatory protein